MDDFEKRVLDVLMYEEKIPREGVFEIHETHLTSYIETYGNTFNNSGSGLRNKNQYRYARKLAGRTLTKLNFIRGAKFNEIDAGMVYLISNPCFPDHYKVGMCLDIVSRLASYQTYDPLRRFKIEKYNFVLNRRHAEKRILSHPDIFREEGEWIRKSNAVELFSSIVG